VVEQNQQRSELREGIETQIVPDGPIERGADTHRNEGQQAMTTPPLGLH